MTSEWTRIAYWPVRTERWSFSLYAVLEAGRCPLPTVQGANHQPARPFFSFYLLYVYYNGPRLAPENLTDLSRRSNLQKENSKTL